MNELPFLIALFGILSAIYFGAFMIGFVLTRADWPNFKSWRRSLREGRIKKFQYFPFRTLLRLWRERKFIRTSIAIAVVNSTMAIACFLFGLCLIAPLIAAFQGLAVGVLMGKSDWRNTVWAGGVLVFEFGAFAMSGAFGMTAAIHILSGGGIEETIIQITEVLPGGYLLFPVMALLGNGFLESAGPIFWRMKGALDLEDLWRGEVQN